MSSAYLAGLVSLLLGTAVILGLASTGGTRRRTILRKLRGSQEDFDFYGDGRKRAVPASRQEDFDFHGDARRRAVPASSRRVEKAEGLSNIPMMLELIAAMLDSGAGLGRALELIAECAAPSIGRPLRAVVAALDLGTDWETAWRSSGGQSAEATRLKDALAFAALTGAPSSAILYAQAARLRREQFRAAEKRAATLGVKLVIPLGLCSLPAFICLGVVPVLLAMLPSAG